VTRPDSVTLVFEYDAPTTAERVARSVALEAGDIEGERTEATVSREAETVTVVVEADDLTALRAGLNTWTTLVEVAESVVTA
jgi:KEOPS complex subunit Pcc1